MDAPEALESVQSQGIGDDAGVGYGLIEVDGDLEPGSMRWIMALVLAVAGGAGLVGLTLTLRVTLPLVARGRPAVGVVKAFAQGESADSESQPSRYAVVQFHSPDGQEHSFRSNVGGEPGIGEKVDVIYDPREPSVARVNTWKALWLGSVLAGVFALIGLGSLVMFLRVPASAWT